MALEDSSINLILDYLRYLDHTTSLILILTRLRYKEGKYFYLHIAGQFNIRIDDQSSKPCPLLREVVSGSEQDAITS